MSEDDPLAGRSGYEMARKALEDARAEAKAAGKEFYDMGYNGE